MLRDFVGASDLYAQQLTRAVHQLREFDRVADSATAFLAFQIDLQQLSAQMNKVASDFESADARQKLLDARVEATSRQLASASTETKHKKAIAALRNDPSRMFLSFESKGDGKVVEVFGDLVKATHIVVLIPGMANDLDNYETQLRAKAKNLFGEMQIQARPGETVAVIAWLGYDTPNMTVAGLREAMNSTVAKQGAQQLLNDIDLFRTTNPSAHFTVVAHSYGSVVVGQAMKRSLRVDDVVVVGSPGMDVTDRADLGQPQTNVWAAKAPGQRVVVPKLPGPIPLPLPLPLPFSMPMLVPDDPIAFAPVHGEDPSAKGFGARRFPANDVKSHSDYFENGTDSLRSIAQIATGQPLRSEVKASKTTDKTTATSKTKKRKSP